MIKLKKMAGRAVLLAGPPGTGKVCSIFFALFVLSDIIFIILNNNLKYTSCLVNLILLFDLKFLFAIIEFSKL